MSNYSSLSRVLSPFRVQTKIEENIRSNRTPPTYNKGHRKKLALTNRFYLTFFLNSIGLLAKKEKNHNNVT